MDAIVAFLRTLLEIFGPVIMLVLGPLLLAVIYKFMKKLGLDTDALNREALQTAITNGALEAVRRAGGPGNALRIDNMHLGPALAQTLKGAPDAIKYFGIGDDEIEKRVLAQATSIVQTTPVVNSPPSTNGGAVSRYAAIDKGLAALARK